jgi:steroid delta-isomerase-like uncharacterized protein
MILTMSTTALIQSYYDAFNAADWNAMLALLTDDVAHDINETGRETGREKFQAFLERMNRSYRERIEEVTVMVSANGANASAEYIVSGTYLVADTGLPEARGQTYRLPGGAFFDVRDGKIARVTNFYNLQDWIKQISG